MISVCCLELEVPDSPVSREGHDAAASIAAHHAAGSVRVVIHHAEVISVAGLQQHQAVGSDAVATVAKPCDLLRRQSQRAVAVVSNQEIISRTLIFIECHHHSVSLNNLDKSSTPSQIFCSDMKEKFMRIVFLPLPSGWKNSPATYATPASSDLS